MNESGQNVYQATYEASSENADYLHKRGSESYVLHLLDKDVH